MLDWNREKLPARNLYDDLLPVFCKSLIKKNNCRVEIAIILLQLL